MKLVFSQRVMENEECGAAKKRRLNESSDDAEMHSEENMQEQLRQFDVLDEVHGDESGSEGSDGRFFFSTFLKSIWNDDRSELDFVYCPL